MAIWFLLVPNKLVCLLVFFLPLLAMAMAVKIYVVGGSLWSRSEASCQALVGASLGPSLDFSLPQCSATVVLDLLPVKINLFLFDLMLFPQLYSSLCFPSCSPLGSSLDLVIHHTLLWPHCFVLSWFSPRYKCIGSGPWQVYPNNFKALALSLPNDAILFFLCAGKMSIYASDIAHPLSFSL